MVAISGTGGALCGRRTSAVLGTLSQKISSFRSPCVVCSCAWGQRAVQGKAL